MKLNNLKSIKQLQEIQSITKTKVSKGKYLSELEMILYCTNITYYSMRILRNEIKVNNRDKILSDVTKEINRIYSILLKDDFYSIENAMTQKQHKENFKRFGITAEKLQH